VTLSPSAGIWTEKAISFDSSIARGRRRSTSGLPHRCAPGMEAKLMSKLSCHCSCIGTHPGRTARGCRASPNALATVWRLEVRAIAGGGGPMPAIQQVPQQFVDSADGVRIAVYEEGNREGPTVVLADGFPDSQVLWDGVAPLLADRFRIIRYDNRGVGQSAVPKPLSAYTMARFADDFAAVTGELSPGRPVHVLAHDWGSVGIW